VPIVVSAVWGPVQVHASIPERKRCAVYTRVSVDDALHEPFGSTEAQFMACHELRLAAGAGLAAQQQALR
jgi:hypothetical protein